jgi:hypothetical protein
MSYESDTFRYPQERLYYFIDCKNLVLLYVFDVVFLWK